MADGSVFGEAQLIGRTARPLVFGGAPNLAFSVNPDRPEFNTLALVGGAWPACRRGRDRHADGQEEGFPGRRHDRRAGPRADPADADLGAGRVRPGVVDRRRDAGRVRPADRATTDGQGGQARPDPGREEGRRLRTATARPRSSRRCPLALRSAAPRSRRPRTPRARADSSTSSGPSCWCSPGSRCSSARS